MHNNTIGVVTTAALPWLTGTSIIPLFHAVYLKKRGYETTLYVPWLPLSQQHRCFQDHAFTSPEEQRTYIAAWLPEALRDFCPKIRFYPSKFIAFLGSILPLVDLDGLVENHDVVLLEEPEHLFVSHPWSRFKKRREHIIGVIMTNYQYYISQYVPAFLARWFQHYSRFLMRRMCHQLVPIAPVQPDVCSLPMCRVALLNAAQPQFFTPPPASRSGRCYFIGKLIPEKGLEEMFRCLQTAGESDIHLYGTGKTEWVTQAAQRYEIRPIFKGITYKPWKDLPGFKIFVNCSKSEMMCTSTANALAMQQWVIITNHPSNQFYSQFRNCLTYNTLDEFVKQFEYALTHEPEFDPQVSRLSWDAAADRLINIIQSRTSPAPK